MRLATVFSGVGAIEQALLQLNINFDIVFACDNGERHLEQSYDEIISHFNNSNCQDINQYVNYLYSQTKKPNYVKDVYFSNYNITEDRWYEDVRFIDGKKYKDNVDLFVGGSPCQSFSIIGKRGGFEDTRGTLFYDFARLIKEIQPKVFIFENVEGLLSHDKGKTWNTMKHVFDELGYYWSYKVLNSKDFGIPQNRKRLFVVGFKKKTDFDFPTGHDLNVDIIDFLDEYVSPKLYLGQKGFEFVTNPKYKNRAQVNGDIMMCQKANQQFNWNGDFVFEPYDCESHSSLSNTRAYLGEYNGEKGFIRKLSNRECFRLMGFPDSFVIKSPSTQSYRQAGNSIVVNILKAIIINILQVCDLNVSE